jgi:cytochrome c peroxidase
VRDFSNQKLVELAKQNDGKQRVPTVRNVDKRPDETYVKAYSHNGYFKSLWSIVHFYNTRDTRPGCVDLSPPKKMRYRKDAGRSRKFGRI